MLNSMMKAGTELGDEHYLKHCLDYSPLPVGMANYNLTGAGMSPALPGIKTPKYFRGATKPQSADVAAVSKARFIQVPGKSEPEVAAMILESIRIDAEQYKTRIPRVYAEVTKTQKSFSGTHLGDALAKSVAGTSESATADFSDSPEVEYFRSKANSPAMQKEILNKIVRELSYRSIDVRRWEVPDASGEPSGEYQEGYKHHGNRGIKTKHVTAEGRKAILELEMGVTTGTKERGESIIELIRINSLAKGGLDIGQIMNMTSQPPTKAVMPKEKGKEKATAASEASAAPTQLAPEGIAESSTTKTTPESEKK